MSETTDTVGGPSELRSAPAPAKPGHSTTEFYSYGAVVAGAMTLAAHDPSPWVRIAAIVVAGACAIMYGRGRAQAKSQTVVSEVRS